LLETFFKSISLLSIAFCSSWFSATVVFCTHDSQERFLNIVTIFTKSLQVYVVTLSQNQKMFLELAAATLKVANA